MKWILQISLALLGMTGRLFAHNDAPEKGRGLVLPTKKEWEKIEKTAPKVTAVKANKIGVFRIQQHLSKNQLAPLNISHVEPAEEFTHAKAKSPITLSALETPLPNSVDNSKLPSFPPIGDQKSLGSCVAWASTYYQASHEIGLLNGNNNKTSFKNVLSPKWTYNLLNNGADNGLVIQAAYGLLKVNGAVNIENFSYDSDYLAWDLNPSDWTSAIQNRMSDFQLIPGLAAPQNLSAIKSALNNGHVLTFGTYIDSWVFTTVPNDPENPGSPYAGQQAATWMNGTRGGHCMTIVGYDDNIWIDVNGNGQVDQGERGAFLIANSWGSDWGNKGFIWISYDAFCALSAVPGGPSKGRVPAGKVLNNCVISVVPKAPNYSPKLIAEFSLTQSLRNQIALSAGNSPLSQTSPQTILALPALQHQGGAYSFDGSGGNAQTASFCCDLTDLLQSANTRYYLSISDNQAGNPTLLDSFVLHDRLHNKITTSGILPKTYDNAAGAVYIDYDFQDALTNDTIPPVAAITSPLNNATLQGNVQVAVNATDNVGIAKVELYVDSVLMATDTTAPYLMSLDTASLSNGAHQLTALAYDLSYNMANSSITVQVENPLPDGCINKIWNTLTGWW